MLDWTDRHCRAFHRLLSRRAVLYTEMAVDQALIHGDPERLIAFDQAEQPVAIQLGGSRPELLAEAARIAAGFGYGRLRRSPSSLGRDRGPAPSASASASPILRARKPGEKQLGGSDLRGN